MKDRLRFTLAVPFLLLIVTYSFFSIRESILDRGHGLIGIYFSIDRPEAAQVLRLDSKVSFFYPSVPKGVSPTNFGVHWIGEIFIPESGTYSFHMRSKDGIRLWINEHPVIDGWKISEPFLSHGTMDLPQGWQKIRIDYFCKDGAGLLQLQWKRPQGAIEDIPTPYLNPPPKT